MVKAYPEEFRRDVIAVARKGETSVRQVAKDFGISETCLARWLRLAVMSGQVVESADGWGSDGGVGPVVIVEVQPAGERLAAFGL